MNDIIENNTDLTPAEVDALMAKLHAADASEGEDAQQEGTIFVAEDSASEPTGTIH
jgi:hypothetical protein